MRFSTAVRDVRSSSRTSESICRSALTLISLTPGRRFNPFSILMAHAPQSIPSTRSLSAVTASADISHLGPPRVASISSTRSLYAPCSHYRVNAMAYEDFSIGHLAKATDTKVETIRYYERIGLLPTPARTPGNYRVY